MLKELDIRQGDLLLDSNVDIICHQVNCQGVMGSGIAKQIKRLYPRVYEQYKLYCDHYRSIGKPLLGRCQFVYCDETETRMVANLFGQEYYGRFKRQTDYDALRRSLSVLARAYLEHPSTMRHGTLSIGFPYLIGCDLAGGDWDVVLPMIQSELADYPGKVEIWCLPQTKSVL